MTFFVFPILQNLQTYQIWFLFGVTPGVDSYPRHSEAISKQQNGEQNLGGKVYYSYLLTLMEN